MIAGNENAKSSKTTLTGCKLFLSSKTALAKFAQEVPMPNSVLPLRL